MLQGETAITIDDKGRLAIPTAVRDVVARAGNRLVVTYNPYETGCLWLYPEAAWEAVRDQVMARGLSNTRERMSPGRMPPRARHRMVSNSQPDW